VRASGEKEARWLREQGHTWSAVLSPGRARQRLAAARGWVDRGEVDAAPARGLGGPARGILDDIWQSGG
jgi:hypothetical protein